MLGALGSLIGIGGNLLGGLFGGGPKIDEYYGQGQQGLLNLIGHLNALPPAYKRKLGFLDRDLLKAVREGRADTAILPQLAYGTTLNALNKGSDAAWRAFNQVASPEQVTSGLAAALLKKQMEQNKHDAAMAAGENMLGLALGAQARRREAAQQLYQNELARAGILGSLYGNLSGRSLDRYSAEKGGRPSGDYGLGGIGSLLAGLWSKPPVSAPPQPGPGQGWV
jgi:hypothetical protein